LYIFGRILNKVSKTNNFALLKCVDIVSHLNKYFKKDVSSHLSRQLRSIKKNISLQELTF